MAFVGVGYFLKKKTNIKSNYISQPLIYFLLPPLVIYHVQMASSAKIVTVPIITFLFAVCMNLSALLAYKTFASKENPHLLKASFTFFNVLFFGIPTVKALFGQEAVSTLISILIGIALYGDIFGYYQVAKTRLSSKEAIKEVFKIPYIYVFALAFALRFFSVQIPKEIDPAIDVLGWVVSALGMMIVGLHVSSVKFGRIHPLYLTKLLVFRSLAAAVLMGILILAEYLLFHRLHQQDYQIIFLLAFFPIAASISLFASFLETAEERFSLLVLFSIGLSLIMVPLVALLLPS